MMHAPRSSLALTLLGTALVSGLVGCGQSESSANKDFDEAIEETGVVQSCHDGDTCYIKLANGEKLTVRLVGIDAPEVSGGEDNAGQPLGKAAKGALNAMVKGKEVLVRELTIDMYERTIGELYVDGTNVNIAMLEKGFAETYIWANSDIDAGAYRDAEHAAKAADRGVWELESYESPSDFRARTQH